MVCRFSISERKFVTNCHILRLRDVAFIALSVPFHSRVQYIDRLAVSRTRGPVETRSHEIAKSSAR